MYPFHRAYDPTCVRDIYDGAVFRQLMADNGFLSKPENTGLILCSDGVPVFKSSKGSLWPIYLMVSSIPPHQRTRTDNLIIAALWYGPVKPDMNVLLQPVLENISHLHHNGIPIKSSNSTVHLRPKLLAAVFDLPARSAATNTKQFNGEYGCFYCLDKGEIYNRARIYPPTDTHVLRTDEDMRRWALEADKTGQVQFGVKGTSILASHLEYPQCIPVDYMHSILEGVF